MQQSSTSVRILIIEDFPMIREGMTKWLEHQSGFTVVGQVGTHAEARVLLAKVTPDLVLLDLVLAEGDGMDFIRELRRLHNQLRILVFSMHDEMLYAERSLRAGAHGYAMKKESTAELLVAIRTVLAGDLYVSRHLAMRLFTQNLQGEKTGHASGLSILTDRELHIFRLIGLGLSPRRIAVELGLSIKTVETHRENIKNKLNLQSSSAVIRRAALWISEQTPTYGGNVMSDPSAT
jgi:DNA-binding NarL/FixJ family response regulator